MLYRSKNPTVHYLFPEGYEIPKGPYKIHDLSGKEFLVSKESILPYIISEKEAQKYMHDELNKSIHNLMGAVRKITGQEKQPDDPKDYLNSNNISGKVKEGADFLGIMADVLKTMWKTASTDDEATLADGKQKMKEVREKLEAKGIKVKDDFEDIPQKMRAQSQNKDYEFSFKESAAKFEEEFAKMKDAFKFNKSKKAE